MAQKKEDLPVNADVDLQNGGTITYATEVISTIAGVAANEIEGIAGMCISGGLSDIIGRNRNITRGVKVEIGSEEASFDLYVIVEYGQPIQKVCHDVQENVRKAIESMTGLHVVRVDVHVQGVSFEKEKQQTEINIEAAKSPALTAGSGDAYSQKNTKNVKKARKKAVAAKETKPAEAPKPEKEAEDAPQARAEAPDETDAVPDAKAPAEHAHEQAEGGKEPVPAEEKASAAEVSEASGESAEVSDPAPSADDGETVEWEAGPVAGGFSEAAANAPAAPGGKKKTKK